MISDVVRTRIAPSPTGDLHIGHFRTVLYNYAYAKKHNGQFIVRIEDTDRKRYVDGALDRTLDVISDYGVPWDEGPRVGGKYAPYIQSECLPRYTEYAHKLVELGAAYYCFCSEERLKSVREEQVKSGALKTKYDGLCRNLDLVESKKRVEAGEKFVIRLKVPKNEKIILKDLVHGDVEFDSNEIDDPILLKSDGFPTYHLAVVIDDHLMAITHVFRGIDWMPSSPIHILLFREFGWEAPAFAHLPNVKEKGSTKKMGKRFGSMFASEFLKDGFLPEATNNLLMFTGWNPGGDKEMYTMDEFIEAFSIDKVHKAELVVLDRDKLLWYNGQYIRKFSPSELSARLKSWATKYSEKPLLTKNEEYDSKVCAAVQDRLQKFSEYAELVKYFYTFETPSTASLMEFAGSELKAKEILFAFKTMYQEIPESGWTKLHLDNKSHGLLLQREWKPKEAFMTLRMALTGSKTTPPIFEVEEVLGKTDTLDRLDKSISNL